MLTTNLTYEPVKNLLLEVAYNRQDSTSISYDSAEFARVQWDTNPTTLTGAPNPRALQPFIEMTPNQHYRNQGVLISIRIVLVATISER